ncbi:MAG: TetR/AcrR family transcriptional regulator [Spirochaetota bacterium]
MGEEHIKRRVYEVARDLFLRKGFRETSVADIARAARIAVGSYYRYYPSKEHLFLEVFSEISLQRESEIMDNEVEGDDPVDYAKRLVRRLNDMDRTDPVLSVWYDRQLRHKITRKCGDAEIGSENQRAVVSLYTNVIARWQQEGKIRTDMDAGFVLALFDSLSVINLYSSEIGDEYFPILIDTLVEFIMHGLRCERDESRREQGEHDE